MSNIHEEIEHDFSEQLWNAKEQIGNSDLASVPRYAAIEIVRAIYMLTMQVAKLNSLLASSNGPSRESPSRK